MQVAPAASAFYIFLTAGDFLSHHIFNKTLFYAMNKTSAFVEKDGSAVYKFTAQRETSCLYSESLQRDAPRRDYSGIKEKMTLDKYKLFYIVSNFHC